MYTGQIWKLHDDAALKRIDGAARRLLIKTGCRIQHEGLLAKLEAAACRIDAAGQRCHFTEKLIDTALAHLGGRRNDTVEIPTGWNPQRRLVLSGSYPHLLDWPSGERRLATRRDVRDIARMGHVLDEFATVGRVLTCAEVDPRVEPLWSTLALAETTDKPIGGGEIFFADYIEPLIRMGEVLTGKPGESSLVASCDFFIAPLFLERKQAACFLEKRRFGIANVPGTMPISGASAPVTLAGTAAIAVAELIAGWVLGYVVNPDLPAGGIVSSGSLDMRTVTTLFGSPEALLQDVTVVQLCRRLYGIPVSAATSYVDCKRPGLEAVFQKMFPLVSSAFGTGLRVEATGLLSAGQDYSPVQHLLDAEILEATERFAGGFEVNDDTLALDLIERTIRDGKVNFVDKEHTLEHFRAEQWYPRWFDRTFWQGTERELASELDMLERMDRRVKDAIARYERPAIDAAKINELKSILAAFERGLEARRQ